MDIAIKETGNGGDIIKKAKDLLIIYGFQNMAYLAMFGGNVEASTPSKRVASEQAFDWWGNSLLMQNDPGLQFNSLTERTLRDTPLTSAGRVAIQEAVKKDLEFMKPFAKISAPIVSIVDTDKVIIGIKVIEPDNIEQREFLYIWDSTRMEVLTPYEESSESDHVLKVGFDYILDFTFS